MNYSMVTRTDSFRRDVRGEVQVVRTLNLSCDGKNLSFIPEGINFGKARGRIRIRHTTRNLPPYMYLLLIPNEVSEDSDAAVWALKTEEDQKEYGIFNEVSFEKLVEQCFLS
jgi:hypothetical protein